MTLIRQDHNKLYEQRCKMFIHETPPLLVYFISFCNFLYNISQGLLPGIRKVKKGPASRCRPLAPYFINLAYDYIEKIITIS